MNQNLERLYALMNQNQYGVGANAYDRDFFRKFYALPPVCREKVMAYIDGMLEALPADMKKSRNL